MNYLAKLVKYARLIYWRIKETLQNTDINLFIVNPPPQKKRKENQSLLYKLKEK